ncbi:MAG TPA: tetratricopeptide repeat protein [Candidatus Krumholzibacteriaceae bacterium]|nr:tetratricopeptide repeat protein [Candidatus Krumholzibacteriaceae bacterium]
MPHFQWFRINTNLVIMIITVAIFAGCAGPPGRHPAAEKPADTGKTPQRRPPEIVIVDANQTAAEGNLKKAASMLEELTDSHPENIKALKLLAKIYSNLGKEDESFTLWERVYKLNPYDPDAAYETSKKLRYREDWSQLRSRMRDLEKKGAADRRHYLMIGRADLRLGYKAEAEKYLLKANGMKEADLLLGKLYYGRGRYSEAQKAFQKTLRKDKGNYSAHIYSGYIYYSRKRYAKALEHYRKALRTRNSSQANLCLAAVHQKLGNYSSAIEYFEDGLSKNDPRGTNERKKAYNTLCRLLIKRGKTDRAYSVIRRGIREFPDSGGLYFYWGTALFKDGFHARAKDKFKKAARDPSWKEIALKKFHSIR